MNEHIVVYVRIVLYLLASMILIMFATIHRDPPRRLRNMALAVFFLTVVVSLIARTAIGLTAQAFANDYLTTVAIVFYVATLCWDFYIASTGKAQ